MLYRITLVLAAVLAFSATGAPAKQQKSSSSGKGLIGKLAKAANESTRTASSKAKDKQSTITVEFSDPSSTISEEIKKADSKTGDARGDKAVVLSLTGEIKERGDSVVLFGQQTKSLKDYLDVMRKAREDKQVRTVVLRFSSSELGTAMAQELRIAVKELRDKGKKVTAIVEDDSQASYLVALACNQIVLPPSGDLMLYGVKADSYFLKNLLDKIGVSVQVVHVGQYKSYGETFTNEDFTTPARQNMTEIVDDLYKQMVDAISSSRDLTREQAEAIINGGPVGAEQAKAANLVDRVAYAEEVLSDLKKSGAEVLQSQEYAKESSQKVDDISLFSLFSMMSKKESSSSSSSDKSTKYPQVAVLYAVGPITLGSSEGVGFGSDEEISSEDIIETLDEIKKDDDIKAMILRVNSPGGSAFASDLIWRKIEELKKTKPVIATMGDVAASGGYYIAMGATKIIAQEGTITGSIGVVGGKPNLQGLYSKLGVKKTSIAKGDYASLFSETSDFSQKERELIEKMMKKTYNEFVSKAAQGRKMPFEKLHEVAQGRVWTGARAKEVGLVDELGGMGKAVQEVKTLIGLTKDDKVSLVAYPKERSLFDYVQKALGGNVTSRLSAQSTAAELLAGSPLPQRLQNLIRTALQVTKMFQREQVLTIMPFVPQIN